MSPARGTNQTIFKYHFHRTRIFWIRILPHFLPNLSEIIISYKTLNRQKNCHILIKYFSNLPRIHKRLVITIHRSIHASEGIEKTLKGGKRKTGGERERERGIDIHGAEGEWRRRSATMRARLAAAFTDMKLLSGPAAPVKGSTDKWSRTRHDSLTNAVTAGPPLVV